MEMAARSGGERAEQRQCAGTPGTLHLYRKSVRALL